ncbi:MAG: hypothetical protein LAQ69_32560 [Acidobacteriia bacterium]|nr:hypothetical protein [Terriglobia bacterium]
MALPQTIRVKLSSEAAEAISLTPVVVQELPIRELIEHMLGVTGKDEARIRELLLRGTLVSGASRFRWVGWESDLEGIRGVLATFPDPDPSRPFAAERCVRATLRGGRKAIEIPREAVARKGLFRRVTFWDLLMEVIGAGGATYAGYSYRQRADRYMREFTIAEAAKLRENSGLVRFSTLSEQIRSAAFSSAELWVARAFLPVCLVLFSLLAGGPFGLS